MDTYKKLYDEYYKSSPAMGYEDTIKTIAETNCSEEEKMIKAMVVSSRYNIKFSETTRLMMKYK